MGSTDVPVDAMALRPAFPVVVRASTRAALLAIDTSTDACAVAVCLPLPSTDLSEPVAPVSVARPANDNTDVPNLAIRDDIVPGARIAACWRRTGAVSSEALLPMVQAILDTAGITLQSVGAIAVGEGPGSFTGVRTATGVAQGLAFANDMPVVPLDTLMVCAESARLRSAADAHPSPVRHGTHVYTAVDARMGECYAAAFSWQPIDGGGHDDGEWRVEVPAHVAAPEALQAHPPGFLLAGNAAAIFGEGLRLRGSAAWCDEGAWPEPMALAALGWRRWHAGGAVAAAMAQPRYVRDKVALTTQERLAVKEARLASKEAGA